ncbi:MAG: transglycosylase SLT domain-containing protein [Acidobacteriota bacterium]
MQKRQREILAKGLLASCLSFTLTFSGFAQGRVSSNGTSDQSPDVQQRNQGIQKILDQSMHNLQDGDSAFNSGDYEKARRAYDRAVDVILEGGYDVQRDEKLGKFYTDLVEHVFQRQLTALKQSTKAIQAQAAANTPTFQPAVATDTTPKAQVAVNQQTRPAPPRGFGQQAYEPSPLDDLARQQLTEEELKDATAADVQSAVEAVRPDFEFRPNALVQSFINYYLGRGRATMENGLRRSGRFMQMAQKIFKEEGVPQDLVWLGQVESAWSPMARSWAAAVGLWQFIPGTGSRYGLRQDYWVDERSSFENSTRASARYLKFLSNRYAGNWELAMAAYNSGEGRVDSSIARSGYADFWVIYDRGLLPMETRNYVPNILATIIIAKNPERYGFSVKPEPPLMYDTVVVNNSVDLQLVADALDVSYDYIRGLNPELKRGVTPPATAHSLRVPVGKGKPLQMALSVIPPDKRSSWRLQTVQAGDSFDSVARRTGVSEATLEAVNGGSLRPGQKLIIPSGTALRNVAATAPKGVMAASVNNDTRIVAYKVKAGEALGEIAARYGVSVRDITVLNRLSASTKLRAGQTLKVPVKQRR